MRQRTQVRRIAQWPGWCTPCQLEDRPLVLTRSGLMGPRAWLRGVTDEDRLLLLTCRVCGGWQHVPPREQDDPEVAVAADVAVLVVPADPIPTPVPAEAPVCRLRLLPAPPAADERAVAAAARLLAEARAAASAPPPAGPRRRPEPPPGRAVVPAAGRTLGRPPGGGIPRPRQTTDAPAPTSIALPGQVQRESRSSGRSLLLAAG